jgi:DNA polymerase-3 subunit gamma/tau
VALYRKYRPETFAEVVGQEHVTVPLSTALDTGRINHAYLFSGPRGCGKTSSARILARSLNCVEGPTSTPCGKCESCVSLAPGGPGNLDVTELDAASHGGVNDARELREKAFYAPSNSRYRVLIIDEAHMVTKDGFNALLKIVEEPPEHLIFVFATTEPEKMLITIRSRTHHYPFRLLTPADMRGLLERTCAAEGIAIEEAVYPLVIRAGGGSPRDALSILDQLLAGSGPEGITYQRALTLLGVTDVALIDEAVMALAAGDGAALFATVAKVAESGHDPRRFATDLLERVRDLILLRAVPEAADRGLVDAPADLLARMIEQAGLIGPATLTRYAETLHAGLGQMRGATAPRLLLEIICARMLLPAASDAESAVLQRLERIEKGGLPAAAAPAQPGGLAAATPSAPSDSEPPRFQRPSQRQQAQQPAAAQSAPPQPASSQQAAPAPQPQQAARPPRQAPAAAQPERGWAASPAQQPAQQNWGQPAQTEGWGQPAAGQPAAQQGWGAQPALQQAAPSGPTLGDVQAAWNALRDKVAERNKVVPAMLAAAQVVAVEGTRLTISHPVRDLGLRIVAPHNAGALTGALSELFGGDWQVEFGSGPAPARPAAQAPAKSAAPRQFSRRSQSGAQARPQQPAGYRPPAPEDDIPLPDGPDYPDDPGPDPYHEAPPAQHVAPAPPAAQSQAQAEAEMMAEAARPQDPATRIDPEEAAAKLIVDVLGATRMD